MPSKPGILVVLGAAMCAAPWASAQSVAPASAEAAALARALEQADGPRRRILEAARLKPAAPSRPRTEGTVTPALGALSAPAPLPPSGAAMSAVPMLPPAELPPPAVLPAELPMPLVPLVLLSLVEPSVPERWLKRTLELPVDLVVQPDGSVDAVAVQAAAPAALIERVVEAVRQWRYAPLPAARPHRVTLVLKPA